MHHSEVSCITKHNAVEESKTVKSRYMYKQVDFMISQTILKLYLQYTFLLS